MTTPQDSGLKALVPAFTAAGFAVIAEPYALEATLTSQPMIEARVLASPRPGKPLLFILFDWRQQQPAIVIHLTTHEGVGCLIHMFTSGHALGALDFKAARAAVDAEASEAPKIAQADRPSHVAGSNGAMGLVRDGFGEHYGSTVVGNSAAKAGDTHMAAALIAHSRADSKAWRSHALAGLLDISAELNRRGFSVRDPQSDPLWAYQMFDREAPMLGVEVSISSYEAEPYILSIRFGTASYAYYMPQRPNLIASHSTTQANLLRTIDVFLAGFKAKPNA